MTDIPMSQREAGIVPCGCVYADDLFLVSHRLLGQLDETETAFDDFWERHHTKLQQCLQLRHFEHNYREVCVCECVLPGQNRFACNTSQNCLCDLCARCGVCKNVHSALVAYIIVNDN